VPTLSARSPHIGRNWEITVRGLRPHSIGLLFFALRDDTFGSSSLPMDLGFLGAPACFLNVNTDPTSGAASHAVPADASGSAIARVPIPSIPSLLGATVFNQYISMDAPVTRRLQITTTNAGRGVIGP
jgi:hypothetical protein